ncbi:Calcium-dependent protein kinase 1 (AtCDPK 1) (CDPK 1) (Calcium-dependent protein kinase isoform AK1) [Durusdinium trenchii]
MGTADGANPVEVAKPVEAALGASGFGEVQLRAMERVGSLPVKGRYVKGRNLQDDFRLTGKVLGTGCSGAVLAAVDRAVTSHRTSGAGAGEKGRPGDQGRRAGMVAVKSYDLELLDDSQRHRLEAELEVFLTLDHPHIARLHYVYESEKVLSLVMECMEGGELYDRVTLAGQTGRQAALATWHMLQAISYIHFSGVVHRDLKLENFLYDFRDSDFLKLIDFGFSKFFCMKKHMKEALGTVNYVAPEVLKKRYSGGSCDMWSLGVIVFVLLTGDMPFLGRTDVEVATAIMKGNYAWKSLRFKVAKEARDFVDHLLVLDPSKRLTAEEALCHPWILSAKNLAEKVCGTSVVTGFRNIARATRFQRACLKAMAWSLSLSERRRLRGVFIDLSAGKDGKDGRGVIEKSQLEAYLSARIPKEHEEDLTLISNILPEEIHYTEFLAAMMACELDDHEDIVRCAFRHFDKEGSGYVTPEVLSEVLGKDMDVSEIFKEADLDKDGQISIDDFVEYLGQITDLPPVDTVPSTATNEPQKLSKAEQFRQAMKSWLRMPRALRDRH